MQMMPIWNLEQVKWQIGRTSKERGVCAIWFTTLIFALLPNGGFRTFCAICTKMHTEQKTPWQKLGFYTDKANMLKIAYF